MPLGDFEREVLRVLAANRNPDSFIAGGTVLHQRDDTPRRSEDVDVFHDLYEDLAEVRLGKPIDLVATKEAWFAAVQEARELVAGLPAAELGCLYLDAGGKPVRPAPASPEFPKLTRHYGSVKGAWPRIVES